METEEKKHIENRIYWSEKDSIKYLTLDFSNLGDLEIFEVALKAFEITSKQELNSLNILSDLSGIDLSFSTFSTLKKLSKEMQGYLNKSGIIGVGKKIIPLYRMYVTFTKSKAKVFNDKDEFLTYLTEK